MRCLLSAPVRACLALVALLAQPANALAEETPPSASAASTTSAVTSQPPPNANVTPRQDPKGISGLSPFGTALLHGDAAYLARNYAGAEYEYRNAIQLAPQDARGHLRLATATFALGRPDDAIQSAEAAARFAGPDAKLRSDALRFIALIVERTGALDRAVAAWQAFALDDAKVPRKVTPPEDVASAHIAAIQAREAALVQGNLVRERIRKELAGEPPIPVSQESSNASSAKSSGTAE
jgi:tetratricopeptide (TPR) repeat protein